MPRPFLHARMRRLTVAAIATAGALLLPITSLAVAAPAMAGGSDAPPPYTVSASGVTLPAGETFRANGHVNAQVIPLSQYTPGETYRARGADWTPMQVTRHFDPNNNQPGGAYIGKSYYPFSGAQQQLPADGYCVVWVQVDGFNEHFGEGGQDPICTSTPGPSKPTPSEPVPSEPTPSEPVPSEPVPSEPTPSEPVPSEPTPSEPAVIRPGIQDYVGACDAAFVLDNSSSTVAVTYTINGVDFLVPAGGGLHTDADGTRIRPVDGQYVITTDTGRTWTFPARECTTVTPPSEPVPSEPVPSEPTPSEPVPSEPVPSEPVPSEPVPSEPVPSEPVPSEPVPSEPVPSEPTPSEPGVDIPAVDPPSEPGVEVPVVDPPSEPTPIDEPSTEQPPTTDVPANGGGSEEPGTEAPVEVGTPVASEQPAVAAPAPSAAQPTPAPASATEAATLPRTGATPLLLVLLGGVLLVVAGAAVRVARR